MWINNESQQTVAIYVTIEFLTKKKLFIDGIPRKLNDLNSLKMLIDRRSDTGNQAFVLPLCEIGRQYELHTEQINQNHGV